MRYNDSMESTTTRGGLPYLRFGKGEPLVALPGVSNGLRARARNPGEPSFELRGLAAERDVYLLSRHEQRQRKFDRVALELLAS